MIPMDFKWIAKVLRVTENLKYINENNKSVSNINTDTRTITSNEVFLALKGANFDGHKFVQQAINQGASAVIVEKDILSELNTKDIVQFIVEDTRLALGLLGSAVKADVAPKTIAITGSVGKTTVKEMTAKILSLNAKVLATRGNFNNDIGVPLTLLRLKPDDKYAVIELGANHVGEIDYTSNLVKPDVATICNVAEAHLEGFGSIDGVAKAKGEIFNGLSDAGTAVLNFDSTYHDFWFDSLTSKKIMQFSSSEQKDVWADSIKFDQLGRASFNLSIENETAFVQLQLPGEHNIKNALTSAALTLSLGIPLKQISQGLSQIKQVKGRVNLIELNNDITIIDDSYNANVQSVKAAIDLLKQIQGHTILALGDMGELGENTLIYHQEVGAYAKSEGIDQLYTLGTLSLGAHEAFYEHNLSYKKTQHFMDRTALLNQLLMDFSQHNKTEKITILIKGSRSAAMELLVQDIINKKKSCDLQSKISGDFSC